MLVLQEVALLEGIHCWKKCLTVVACFVVSYVQPIPSVEHSLLLLPVDKDVELSTYSSASYLPACLKGTKSLKLQASHN